MNSGCTYAGINKQLIKEEGRKTELISRLFEVFNIDSTKNREVTSTRIERIGL